MKLLSRDKMMNYFAKFFLVTICICFFGLYLSKAQNGSTNLLGKRNVITTSVPFLSITPDSRSGGLADAGIALPPDANAPYWNPSKLAYVPNKAGLSVSYTPWLSKLVPDINLSYLSGYYKIDELSAGGISLRYFSLGDIQFRDKNGNELTQFRPTEFSLGLSYGRKLSDNLSLGISLRGIRSNLAGNTPTAGGTETKPGHAISGDISAYWNNDIDLFNLPAELAFGLNMRNVGSKITYTTEAERDFIPMNLGLGSYLNFNLDQYNEIALLVDFNKLLVPTPPEYATDSDGNPVYVNNGNGRRLKVRSGYRPDVSVTQGLVQSFYDAPGGFQEERREIKPSIGVEYWYDEQFSIRAGYFFEHENKGDRKYATVGAGLRYNLLGVDVSYLIPTESEPGTSPLANTIRISLSLDLDPKKLSGENEDDS